MKLVALQKLTQFSWEVEPTLQQSFPLILYEHATFVKYFSSTTGIGSSPYPAAHKPLSSVRSSKYCVVNLGIPIKNETKHLLPLSGLSRSKHLNVAGQ